MALPILDGNQTATTLSTIVAGGQHIPAHTVVSLGSQAISDISNAVSSVQVSGTVTASIFGKNANFSGGITEFQLPVIGFDETIETADVGIVVPVQISNDLGTIRSANPLPISGTVTVGNSVTIGSLPAISGTVTARLQDGSGNNLTSTSIGGLNRLNVTLSSAGSTGTTAPAVANLYGGTDGTNLRAISVDSTGRQNINAHLPRVTLIDGSGTVTTANSAITVFASSSTRSYLLVQVTTGSAFVNVGATATTVNGLSLTAGQGYSWETTIPQGVVSLISATTSSRWVAKEA